MLADLVATHLGHSGKPAYVTNKNVIRMFDIAMAVINDKTISWYPPRYRFAKNVVINMADPGSLRKLDRQIDNALKYFVEVEKLSYAIVWVNDKTKSLRRGH